MNKTTPHEGVVHALHVWMHMLDISSRERGHTCTNIYYIIQMPMRGLTRVYLQGLSSGT